MSHVKYTAGSLNLRQPRSFNGRRLIALLIMGVLILPLLFAAATLHDTNTAQGTGIVQFVMCSWEDPDDKNTIPVIKTVYEITQTDDLQYQLFSKSSVSASASNAHYDLPSLITLTDFDKNNLDIVNSGNKTAKKYTPYDLYGFSGMTFTAYQGEWNWLKVYYCTSNGKGTGDDKPPEDQKLNLYYDKRVRPIDTWTSRQSSQDPRVRQRTNNLYASNMALNIANVLFWLTKFITALCTSLMALSFTDIVTKLGLATAVQPIMHNLFQGMFIPLMVMMMAFTGFYIVVHGLIKRQYATAMKALLQTLGSMALGIFMMLFPTLFLSLPNTVGLLGQYLVMSGLNNTVHVSGDDFCSTATNEAGFHSLTTPLVVNGKIDDKAITNALSDVGDATSRTMTCSYWKLFALTPYSLGEYGTTYDNLYAKGKAPQGTKELGNKNDYPGLAAVPVGGNKQAINNWLIYQISTQNLSHIPSTMADPNTGEITKPDKALTNINQYSDKNKRINETNGDWYRVVDALSNYNVDDKGNKTKDSATTTNYWSQWVGNNSYYRIVIAFISLLVAAIGTLGPLVMGASVLLASVSCVILMAFAPLALTFGMWAGKGQEILKGWSGLLLQSIIKRVVLGAVYMILLMLDLIIMRGIIGVGDYLKSVLIMVLLSWAIVHNRHVIVDKFSNVSASGAFSSTRNIIGNKMANKAKNTAKFTGTMAVSAGAGMKAGLGKNKFTSAAKGMQIGARTEVKNGLYRTDAGRKVLQAYTISKDQNVRAEEFKNGINPDDENDEKLIQYYDCESCGKKVSASDYVDVKGHIICNDCYDSGEWRSIPGADKW